MGLASGLSELVMHLLPGSIARGAVKTVEKNKALYSGPDVDQSTSYIVGFFMVALVGWMIFDYLRLNKTKTNKNSVKESEKK